MIRTILHYPDKRLRNPGLPVTDFGAEFQALVDDMAETMYEAPGVGLAAPQIGVSLALFVVDCAEADTPSDFRVFANPVILETRQTVSWTEGCLSFPNAQEDIERSKWVKVKAQDRNGNWFELETEGLLAIAVQHEFDHLQGKLMIDRIGPLKKRLLHRKMEKRATAQARAGA
jgi:peptide deformylase